MAIAGVRPNHAARHLIALLLCGLMTMTCASPATKVTQEMETARSWMATVDMVAGRWAENRVPSAYARRTLTEAREALHSVDRALLSADAHGEISAQARTHIAGADRLTQSLLSAIAASDRRAVLGPRARLAREREALDALLQDAGTQ
jgi:hypothetical protein